MKVATVYVVRSKVQKLLQEEVQALDQAPTETSVADLDRPVAAVREVLRVQGGRLMRWKLSNERGY